MNILSTSNLSSILSSYWNTSTVTQNQSVKSTSQDSSNNKAAMRDLIDKVSSGTGSESDIEALLAKRLLSLFF